jgi:predicted phage terminase large subunit-like protein
MERTLQDVEAGKIRRLIIELPPRHGKSKTASQHFPAWYLEKHPDDRVVLCSYTESLAAFFSGKVRGLVDNFPEFGLRLSQSSSAKNQWDIEGHEGGMIAAGIGGPITGWGGNLIIVDDPIKNNAEANSPTFRENIWNWYTDTLYTRLEPDSRLVIIMTRWHEDDLVGRVLTQEKDENDEEWTVLRLPAICEDEDDLLGRKIGEALWSERYPIKKLLSLKTKLRNSFNALYQQRPGDKAGTFFNSVKLKYAVDMGNAWQTEKGVFLKSECFTVQMVDLAVSLKANADYFVIGTAQLLPNHDLILVDVFRDHISAPEQLRILQSKFWEYGAGIIGIESVAYQLAMVQLAVAKGLPAVAVHCPTDKQLRAVTIAARMESGSVYFVRGAAWIPVVKGELVGFPFAANDDTVDVLSMLGIWAASKEAEPNYTATVGHHN